MNRWVLTWATALVLATVSCTGATETTSAQSDEETVHGPGRLVVLDGTGNVVVMDPDGTSRSELTDGAGLSAAYTQPVWSPDAVSLAWGQVTEDGFAVSIESPGSGESTTLVETSNLPFYVSWSPDGRSLGVLHNGDGGIDFRLVDVEMGTSVTVDTAAPYYFSWSPAGDQLVTHAGEDRVERIATDGGRVRLEPSSSMYLAPQWTAEGVFHVAGGELVLEDAQGERRPVADVSGLTMFVADPDGTRVALQVADGVGTARVAFDDAPVVPTGGVVVVDVESLEVSTVSSSLSVGLFWSPDGESLLVFEAGDGVVTPLVWNTSGEIAAYPEFIPSGAMVRDTLPFFPQYAQSVSFWAPGSSAFAFAGEVEDEIGIWVQELKGLAPVKVSDGTWVAWSSGRS